MDTKRRYFIQFVFKGAKKTRRLFWTVGACAVILNMVAALLNGGNVIVTFLVDKNQSSSRTIKRGIYENWTPQSHSSKSIFKLIESNMSAHEILGALIYNVSADASRIHLQYPSFQIPVPNFGDQEDQKIFLSESRHYQLMSRPHIDHLTGIISLHNRSYLNQMLAKECGWQKLLPPKNGTANEWTEPAPRDLDLNTLSAILVILHVPEGYTFQHFMDGTLPKLMQISPLLQNSKVHLFLQHKPRVVDQIVYQILLKLGIPMSRMHFSMKDKNVPRNSSDVLILDTCVAPPLHPLLLNMARESLGVTSYLQPEVMSQTHVILISRSKSHNPGRKIINERDIVAYLKKRYDQNFKLWKGLTKLNTGLELFGNTRLIIGVHGAGLYNSFFCPNNTAILEIMPMKDYNKSGLATSIFWMTTSLYGQTYFRTHEKALDRHNNIGLSVLKLEMILDKIDKEQNITHKSLPGKISTY